MIGFSPSEPQKMPSKPPIPDESASIARGPDLFRLLVESVSDYAIFMLDPTGHVMSWNAGAERIKQYEADEIIGKHFSIFYPREDVLAEKPDWELQEAERLGRFEDEGWRIRKDGTSFWANVIINSIRDYDGNLVGFAKVTRDITERRAHEKQIEESEQRFRLLVEGARDYAIYMMDPQGLVTTWNAGAERIKGYTAQEIIGKHFSTFFAESDVQSGEPNEILERARDQGRAEHEGWRVRKDGSRFWVYAIVTALRDKSGNLIGYSKITRDMTERMRQQDALKKQIAEKEVAERELARSEESLRELSLTLLRTQDEERRRIGREMHDSLGQYLSVLKMKLETVGVKYRSVSPEIGKEFAECSELLDECVKEVRTISYLLYPPMLEEMGLKSAIAWYLDGFTQRSAISVRFSADDNFERLPRDIELALFRVLQETLTNVLKHSGSDRVDIGLSETDGLASLQVRDYGKGLPAAMSGQNGSLYSSTGVGLRSMKERMAQLGGVLHVTSASPGTLVSVTVPAQRSVANLKSSDID
jgi:PAS domain S-box-containing protein